MLAAAEACFGECPWGRKSQGGFGCVDASSEVLSECLKVGKTELDPDGEDPREGKMRQGHQQQTARGG